MAEDDEMRVPVREACCESWRKAHEYATDNEMYLSLVHEAEGGAYPFIGSGLPPVKFCPWCGAEKGKE